MLLYLDFETRSSIDLKKVGLHRYAHHPSTEVLCTGWAVDDGPALVEPGIPGQVIRAIQQGATLVAHNAAMERETLAAHGFELPWERWIDTAALAARMSLPRGLGALAEALHLEEQKDDAGHRIMLKLSRPKGGWSDDEWWDEEEKPADFAALREYCRQDVEVMRLCHKRLLPLSDEEGAIYRLTQRMNDAGVEVDLAAIPAAKSLLAQSSAAGEARFRVLTGGHGVKSYARVAAALGLPDVRKPTVRTHLRRNDLTPRVREALELFQKLARSSPAKLSAFENRTSPDGRCRGMLVYCGAERTGRWSGMGVQPQNFPRGLGEGTEEFFDALEHGVVEHLYDNPVATVAEALRGFLVGPFIVGDYSQIEARTLAWLAGQADLLKVFAEKGDPYKHMASRIYGKPMAEVTKDERFMGKQVVLGCGYGMGSQKFQRMLSEIYDVDISADLAMRVVSMYRSVNARIVAFWGRLERAFIHVVQSGKPLVCVTPNIKMGNIEVGGIRYAFIELPSGRRLYYCEPEMSADGVRYWGRNIYTGGKWDRVSTYGGKLAENVTQATSRDLMAQAMLKLDAEGFRLLLTVHDEIVADDNGLSEKFKAVMLSLPGWAQGLPVDAEVFSSRRYRK